MTASGDNEKELANLLQQLPPQLPEPADRFALVQARVHRRRRMSASWCIAVFVVLVALIPVAVRGLQHDGRSAVASVTEPTATVPSGTPADPSETPVPDAPPADMNDPAAYTKLSECPEALAFVTQPEVQQNLEKWRGTALGPQDSWYGGCPSIEDLQHMLDLQEDAYNDRLDMGDPWPDSKDR